MSTPTRRKNDFPYQLPSDLEFRPNRLQIESARLRAQDRYQPRRKSLLVPLFALLVMGLALWGILKIVIGF